MSQPTVRPTAQYSFVLFIWTLIASLILLGGCAQSGFHGSSIMSKSGCQEEITANSDQTYHEKITCPSGKILQTSGTWELADATGMGNIPNSNPSDPHIIFKGAYDTMNCCSGAANPPVTDEIDTESMFQISQDEVQSNAANTNAALTGLALVCLFFWVWAVIDICRRSFEDVNQKIAWVVAILACGGIGSILYLIVGRKSGEIPGQIMYK